MAAVRRGDWNQGVYMAFSPHPFPNMEIDGFNCIIMDFLTRRHHVQDFPHLFRSITHLWGEPFGDRMDRPLTVSCDQRNMQSLGVYTWSLDTYTPSFNIFPQNTFDLQHEGRVPAGKIGREKKHNYIPLIDW